MAIIREKGFSIPNDISCIGFDGILQALFASPLRSTVVQPIKEIAKVATGMVIECMTG
jgi:DNA-binding LacI/PurR family transcriptional regulator